MRSVLFFDGFTVTWMCGTNLAWLPERKAWGEFLICINPRWPPCRDLGINFNPDDVKTHVMVGFVTKNNF